MNTKTKNFITSVGFLSLVFLPLSVFAGEYKLLEPIPGFKDGNAADYFTALYNFAIMVVGVAALLMVIVGAFWYITSAGNQARMGTAKSVMWDAILGLSVAVLAWIILNTINPDIVSGNISRLNGVEVPAGPEGPEEPPEGTECPPGQFVVCQPDGTDCGCSSGTSG